MARTTVDQVEAIVDIDSGISLAPFIEIANAIVTEKCATATDADGNLVHDATRLELIERWLSAHFYHIRDNRPNIDKADVVSRAYRSKVDLGFNVTHYGQQAMLIDTSGALSRLNQQSQSGKGNTVSFSWLGKTRSEANGTS